MRGLNAAWAAERADFTKRLMEMSVIQRAKAAQ